jgi:hypothetical protein
MIWQDLLNEFSTAIGTQNSMNLALFLIKIINLQDMENFHIDSTQINFTLINKSICQVTNNYEDDYFQQIFFSSIDLLISLKNLNIENQIKNEIELINLFSKKLLENPSFYLTPTIIIAKDIRKRVFNNFNDAESSIVDLFTNSIQRPFKILISNKSENKINISAIHIFASHLFSIYFKYNKLNAAINLYKVLSNTILNDKFNENTHIDIIPILPTKSLFDYFIALSLLIQSNYSKSLQYFQSSYESKHSKSFNIKILFYLLPLNYLINNKLPTDAFFNEPNNQLLKLLQPIYNSIKKLDADNYNILLENYKLLFLHFRVYAIYIQLHTKILLESIITIHNIYKDTTTSQKPHIIPISIFANGLQLSLLQTESLLCRLIASKNIKGYLSHSQQVIVLSKTSPFIYSPI